MSRILENEIEAGVNGFGTSFICVNNECDGRGECVRQLCTLPEPKISTWVTSLTNDLNLMNQFESFQLWEDAQLENIRLRDDLSKVRDDLKSTKKKLDTAIAVRFRRRKSIRIRVLNRRKYWR